MADDKIVKDDDEWRSNLTPEQYAITRCSATERPFTGPWLDEKREGTFVCICCGSELFRSDTKYESGSGWPSFFDAIEPGVIATKEDTSHGMRRIEILCAKCDAHLGHVFPDGPKPTGLRYCTNGHALDFKPDAG
ncbi:MAG: peptide-methionine (R)-S-oxide reductase MsrB [Alphaproteobacteria bacterium]|nr:peptide-methionine (R)-S-oxide reductase MsrB [Alphaproteobacteria bacterium]MDX5417385.1 peptide-methionine (R)-S-oxide reductase MsrB [Alphaproteobacteria bacterium]MDX5494856.1 peptide-methionine (R)-S-oxide reductase MsrB [Alphaproteobacteria bacterium]